MKTNLLFTFFLLIATITSIATTNDDGCKVLVKELQGSYDGDCKKGLAHGEGKAKGTDEYIGAFKKGFPDGEGKYTWADGHYYKGSFKKGEMDGEGELVYTDSPEKSKKGYWENGKYIGISKYPYKIIAFDSSQIDRIQIINNSDEQNELHFGFYRQNGGGIGAKELKIIDQAGKTWQITTGQLDVVNFPFKGKGSCNVPGPGGKGSVTINFTFEIYQPGEWTVKVILLDV